MKVIVNVAEGLELSATESEMVRLKVSEIKASFAGKDADVYISILPEKDAIAVNYKAVYPKFERIRRITGYLVGTIDRWNNAKRAEEHDRLVHV